jgi:hypothetical protein
MMVVEWRSRSGPLLQISPDSPEAVFPRAEASAKPEAQAAVVEPPTVSTDMEGASDPATAPIAPTADPAPVSQPEPESPLPPLTTGPVDSIIDLQPYRSTESLANEAGDWVRLTNLNPRVGSWYLLETHFQKEDLRFHLETFSPDAVLGHKPGLSLYHNGLAVITPAQSEYFPLWSPDPAPNAPDQDVTTLHPAPVLSQALRDALKGSSPLTLLCGNTVLVRTQRPGSATELEFATDFLRRTRMGDWLVEQVKPWMIQPPEKAASRRGNADVPVHAQEPGWPRDARLDPARTSVSHEPRALGIEVDAAGPELDYGRWYQAVHHPGAYVSILIPAVVDTEILESYPDRVFQMGPQNRRGTEANNVTYLVAFDLDRFAFGYCLGAQHPAVEWSERAKAAPNKMAGPDGFRAKAPLTTVGAVPPYLAHRAAATFAGGFKREHGSFLYGELGRVNNGSHFGFVEQGVIFSSLTPGLATASIALDGSIDLLTWPQDPNPLFPNLLHARQNGVPIIEGLNEQGISIPGALVKESGVGSWSGNKQGELMTIRSAVGVQDTADGKHFLLLAYFTGATPNGMARVFQAYGCRYAMGLDMNSPALCYSALYVRDEKGEVTRAEYLVKDMAKANNANGTLRFLQNNDTRDFFYVLRKS